MLHIIDKKYINKRSLYVVSLVLYYIRPLCNYSEYLVRELRRNSKYLLFDQKYSIIENE